MNTKNQKESRGRELAETRRLLARAALRNTSLEKKLALSRANALALGDQLSNIKKQKSLLSRRILTVQEEERKRISRELHDVIAQMLTGINLRLEKMNMDVTRGGRSVSKNLQSTQRLVEKSMGIVHRFARELRPAALDDLGLIPALRSLVDEVSRESGLKIQLNVFPGVERMKSNKRTVIYRVVQESLMNIGQHAHATRAEIKLVPLTARMRMTIQDNGKGFDAEAVFSDKSSQCMGLLGMRERVEMVGGSFSITSDPGGGTRLQADIPLAPPRKTRVSP